MEAVLALVSLLLLLSLLRDGKNRININQPPTYPKPPAPPAPPRIHTTKEERYYV